MKPRITISRSADGGLEIWLNDAGRDLLVEVLRALSQSNDHVHLGPPDLAEVPLQQIAYRDEDDVIDWAKIIFRPDAWDAEHFPHVLHDAGEGEAKP